MPGNVEVRKVDAHLVDIAAFERFPGRHLETAWADDAVLIATIDGVPRIVVETVEDLEVVHRMATDADRGPFSP